MGREQTDAGLANRHDFRSRYDEGNKTYGFCFGTGSGCWAQNSLTVQVKGRQKWSPEEVDRLYLSACSAVQREFGGKRPVRPRLTLVLGADKDEADLDRREIRLIKWNPFLFAEGVRGVCR